MIHPDQALAVIATQDVRQPDSEEVSLLEALGRIPARDLPGLVDQPPFDKSGMDGFAYAPPAGPGGYLILGTVAAGHPFGQALRPGECVKIMTGAPIPEGAQAVQRVEWTETKGNRVVFTREEGSDNIIRRGENGRAGDPILSRRRIEAQDLGILAASGYSSVPVVRRPVVGVLSTGAELMEAGAALWPGRIHDSNRAMLLAQVRGAGAAALDLGIADDDVPSTERAFAAALDRCDVVVSSGGVSMGEFDFVPQVLRSLGVGCLFHSVALKPGKPSWFGRRGDSFVFGLPGNPVSVFVNFEFLVRPLLDRMLGVTRKADEAEVRFSVPVRRSNADRVEFIPVSLAGGAAAPVPYGGSSMLSVLSRADGFVRMEAGEMEISQGGRRRVGRIRQEY